LHEDLMSEFSPDGPLQEDAVATIARLLWRKQNLDTFRIAERARKRLAAIWLEKVPSTTPPLPDFDLLLNRSTDWEPPSAPEIEEGKKVAEQQARKELGTDCYLLADMGDGATISRMLEDLKVEERLGSLIGQQVKRLMLLNEISLHRFIISIITCSFTSLRGTKESSMSCSLNTAFEVSKK
jgi:hypothetical protein